jgi:flagellar biosynthesis protein FlhF
VEQLRTFARIASLPLEVVYQPQDMPSAIQKHRDKDLIVIDTVGRSHRDKEKMRELAAFIEAAEAVEIHLTLSVGTKLNDLIDIVDRFKVVPSTCYLFTKLDETTNFGNILNLIKHRPKSISLFTLGQNVPDDIAWAEKGSLARLMLSRDLDEAAISKGLYVRPSAKTQRISIG